MLLLAPPVVVVATEWVEEILRVPLVLPPLLLLLFDALVVSSVKVIEPPLVWIREGFVCCGDLLEAHLRVWVLVLVRVVLLGRVCRDNAESAPHTVRHNTRATIGQGALLSGM